MSCSSRRSVSVAMSVLLLAVSLCASAQEAPAASTSPPPAVQLDRALEGAGDEYGRIAAQTDLYRAETALLEAQRAAEEARARLSGGVGAQAAPLLIGIFGAGDVRLAEIAVGSTARRLRVGDFVSDDWRLVQIEQGSVVLADRSGARSRLFLNKRAAPEPVSASSIQQAPPGATPGMTAGIPGVAQPPSRSQF
ncbi:hypothetical protein [Dolichospermum phage Dfl-JY45]